MSDLEIIFGLCVGMPLFFAIFIVGLWLWEKWMEKHG